MPSNGQCGSRNLRVTFWLTKVGLKPGLSKMACAVLRLNKDLKNSHKYGVGITWIPSIRYAEGWISHHLANLEGVVAEYLEIYWAWLGLGANWLGRDNVAWACAEWLGLDKLACGLEQCGLYWTAVCRGPCSPYSAVTAVITGRVSANFSLQERQGVFFCQTGMFNWRKVASHLYLLKCPPKFNVFRLISCFFLVLSLLQDFSLVSCRSAAASKSTGSRSGFSQCVPETQNFILGSVVGLGVGAMLGLMLSLDVTRAKVQHVLPLWWCTGTLPGHSFMCGSIIELYGQFLFGGSGWFWPEKI
jgi:hypothetical protein